MKIEKLFFPLTVAAAIISIYLLFRNSNVGDSGATVPNPSASGVGVSGSGVQPINYNVPAVSLAPNPLVLLGSPYDTSPGSSSVNDRPPAYLVSNFGPSHDLTKDHASNFTPANHSSGGCGCESEKKCANSCNSANAYPDGSGATPMSTTRARQINSSDPADWLVRARDNVNNWLELQNSEPSIPTLTSGQPASPISDVPTNGSPTLHSVEPSLNGLVRPPSRQTGFAYIN